MDKDKIYIPKTVGELVDQLGSMMLGAPTFVDRTGYFRQSVGTEFFALNEGLKAVRPKVGEELYDQLVAMSDRMRALFEADPEDTTGQAWDGRHLIDEMQQALIASQRRKRRQ